MYKEQEKGDIIVGSAKEHGCGFKLEGPPHTGPGVGRQR